MNQKDVEHALLFNFGSREKQHKREVSEHVIPFINLEDEETREMEMIQIHMKKYSKALKNIFVKYSNTGFSQQFSSKSSNSFDSIKEHSSMISVPEIYKFIKDYDLADRLNKDEHQVS